MNGHRQQAVAWIAVLLAAAALAVGLGHGIDGWPTAATHLRDDAFYEFTWACNLMSGRGPVVSDGVRTSGVPTLWCLLLGYACDGQRQAVADFAVVLGIACHVGAALTFAVAGRWRPAGLSAALLWLGNPLLLRECQNGQETALACLLAAALWHARRGPQWRCVGLSLLLVLTRSDLWLLVAALALVRPRRDGHAALVAPVAALLLLLAVDLALGGGAWPDSALPMAWLAHANFAATGPTLAEQLQQYWWFGRPVLFGHPFAMVSVPGLGALLFLVLRPKVSRAVRAVPAAAVGIALLCGASDLAVPAVAAVLLLLRPRAVPGPMPRELLALAAALGAVVLLHWGVRWYPRDYYLAPLAVGAGAAVLRLRRLPWLLCLVSMLQLLQQLVAPLSPEPLRHQRAMQVAGAVLQLVVPPTERVGCFNAGIVAFSLSASGADAPVVVGLDGVVDARAFAALRRRELAAFLDARGIRFLADHPAQWSLDPTMPHACGQWFGGGFLPQRDLRELIRCVVPGTDAGRPGTEAFTVCWREGRGVPPRAIEAISQPAWLDDGTPVVVWPAAAGATLELEQRDGSRRPLLTADRSAVFALPVQQSERDTARVFEHGADEPALVLRRRPR